MKKRLIALTLLLAIALTGCNRHTELKPTIAHEENKTTESLVNAKPVIPTEEPTSAASTEGTSEAPTEVATENGATEPTTEWAIENGTVEEPTGEVATENLTQAPTQQPTTSQPTTQVQTTVQATTKQPTTTQQQPTTQILTTQQQTTQQPTVKETLDEDKARAAVLAGLSKARKELTGWGELSLDPRSYTAYSHAQAKADEVDWLRVNMPAELERNRGCGGGLFTFYEIDYDAISSYYYNEYVKEYGELCIGDFNEPLFYEEICTVVVSIGVDSTGKYYLYVDASRISMELCVQATFDGITDFRATLGYNPFPRNEKLMAQAQAWADMLAANPSWYNDKNKVHSSTCEGMQKIPCSETVAAIGGTASSAYDSAYLMYSHCSTIKRPDEKEVEMGVGVAEDADGNRYVVMQFCSGWYVDLVTQ